MKVYAVIGMIVFTNCLLGQSKSQKITLQEGNDAYSKGDYSSATEKYTAAKENDAYFKADFNSGNSLYKQKLFEEATNQFNALVNTAESNIDRAKAYHNLGNSFMSQKKYENAVSAYKNALKNNPKDSDTRYNLSYALEMLKQQEQ